MKSLFGLERMARACVLSLALASCALPTGPPRPPPSREPARGACPLGLEGVSVVAERTPDGVALVFRSRGDVAELRERVRGAARLHGPFGQLGKGHDGRHGGGGHHGLKAHELPVARAQVQDIEGGARLSLVPVYPFEVDALRSRVEARALEMSTAPCDR